MLYGIAVLSAVNLMAFLLDQETSQMSLFFNSILPSASVMPWVYLYLSNHLLGNRRGKWINSQLFWSRIKVFNKWVERQRKESNNSSSHNNGNRNLELLNGLYAQIHGAPWVDIKINSIIGLPRNTQNEVYSCIGQHLFYPPPSVHLY